VAEAFGTDGQDVAFHIDVDLARVDARQIALDNELVTVAPGIQRHPGWAGDGSEHLLCEPVEFHGTGHFATASVNLLTFHY
jgi:hypothetical protein